MPGPRSERRSAWPAVVLGVGLLPVVYVLSAGPTVRLIEGGYVPEGVGVRIYAPLKWVTERSHTDGVMRRYIRMWCAEPYCLWPIGRLNIND